RLLVEIAVNLEDVPEVVITLVTRIFVEWPVRLDHRNLRAPRARPGCRIVNGKFIVHRVSVDAPEPLHDVQRPGGSLPPSPLGEVPGLDDQCVAFPMTP